MEEKSSFYAIIPATVRYDKDLSPNEKLFYGEITCLTQKTGECWATNAYFSELYNMTNQSVSRCIRHLKEKGYINLVIIYKPHSKEIDKRIITLPINNNVNAYNLKSGEGININSNKGININDKENITSINNTSLIIQDKENINKRNFQKPTIEEIRDYCNERNNFIDAEQFYDFYESKGWLVGKNKMKDWKACIRTWEKTNHAKNNTSNQKKSRNQEQWELLKGLYNGEIKVN